MPKNYSSKGSLSVIRNLGCKAVFKHLTIEILQQQLRLKLQAFTAVDPGSIPVVGELRFHKPHSAGKAKQETLNDYPQSSWHVAGTQKPQFSFLPSPPWGTVPCFLRTGHNVIQSLIQTHVRV